MNLLPTLGNSNGNGNGNGMSPAHGNMADIYTFGRRSDMPSILKEGTITSTLSTDFSFTC